MSPNQAARAISTLFIPGNVSCTATLDCLGLYPALDLACYQGFCECDDGFGLSGENCVSFSPASSATTAVLAVATGAVLLTALRFSVGFWSAVIHRRMHMDVATGTYVTSWLNIMCVCIEASSIFVLTQKPSSAILKLSEVSWYIGMILLSSSLVFMELSFVEMTKMVHRQDKTSQKVCAAFILLLAIVGALLISLTPPQTWAIAVCVLLSLLSVFNLISPSILYVVSSRSMAKAAARPTPASLPLLGHIFWEVIACRPPPNPLSEDKAVINSIMLAPRKLDIVKPAESLSMMRFHGGTVDAKSEESTDRMMDLLNRSQMLVNKNTVKREMALMDFLRRAMRMAVWVSLGLLAYVGLTIAYYVALPLMDNSPTIRLVGLLLALRLVVYIFVLHHILLFLNKRFAGLIMSPEAPSADANWRSSKDFRYWHWSHRHSARTPTPGTSKSGSWESEGGDVVSQPYVHTLTISPRSSKPGSFQSLDAVGEEEIDETGPGGVTWSAFMLNSYQGRGTVALGLLKEQKNEADVPEQNNEAEV